MELPEPQDGRVKWYNISKNFGFLVTEAGEEVFVHHHDIVYPGSGKCEHGRGQCARATGLLSDKQQTELQTAFSPRRLEQMLINAPVRFRVVSTERGPEARSVKRASA